LFFGIERVVIPSEAEAAVTLVAVLLLMLSWHRKLDNELEKATRDCFQWRWAAEGAPDSAEEERVRA